VLSLEADAGEVERVEVDAGLLTLAMDALNAEPPLTAVGVNFSTPLSVAVALLAGKLTPDELAPEWLEENRERVRALAARVTVRHDWELTLRTARGALEGGASLRDVPPLALPRLLGHLREAAGDGAGLDLRALARDRRLRAQLGRLAREARRAGPAGIAGLDVQRLRMTFPARVRVRLRSGATLAADGAERGSSGRPLEEQRDVVATRSATVSA
jgi:hypothetical protein